MTKARLYDIIFEADTPEGRAFDVALLILIVISIIFTMLESVPSYNARYHGLFETTEWIITIIFTIEYFLRLYVVKNPMQYARSMYGMIDLLAILPSFLELIFPGAQYLKVIRSMRLIRAFRVFQLSQFQAEGNNIVYSLRASMPKITIFLTFIVVMVIIIGSVMFVIESPVNPQFTSIPASVYWAIVTLTTVGYGDISPVTNLGQFLASMVMILGYAVIAVPTGIVTTNLVNSGKKGVTNITCTSCLREGHDPDADYCKYCGEELEQ